MIGSRTIKGVRVKIVGRSKRFSAKVIHAVGFVKRSRAYEVLCDKRFMLLNKLATGEKYFINQVSPLDRKSSRAVILHLYHKETWEEIFKRKLTVLARRVDFDLFVTMPKEHATYASIIQKTFPTATILIVPNKGRDVLPFIKTLDLLKNAGYEKLLKIQSKKSAHRDTSNTASAGGGDLWLSNTLDALIPEDEKTFGKLFQKIENKNTGMIGPLDYYYPFKMYLGHNRTIIERILAPHIDESFFTAAVSTQLEKIGFFGGTMFWASLDAIADVLPISKYNFQKEKGQTDGTTAHALERVFCVLPQLSGKSVYGISGHQIVKIKSGDAVYPKWYYDDVSGGKPQISIVVPVYGDWSSLSQNIRSLKRVVANSEDISVHYVNDCGPEADMLEQKILQNIQGLTNFYYYRNERNLGFVQNCNHAAMELVDQASDVLLLNSDTKVTNNFVFEMREVLYSEPDIGAVTSRSNNATIWSVPMNGRLANYRWASYLLYRLIRGALPDKYITPTIHGFCVLIRRNVIKEYGLFDEVYGKGFGEENDFAMRMRAHGWKCAVANRSYVFHYESRSFGDDVRKQKIEQNEKILVKRYPEYRQLIQEYWDSIKEPLL